MADEPSWLNVHAVQGKFTSQEAFRSFLEARLSSLPPDGGNVFVLAEDALSEGFDLTRRQGKEFANKIRDLLSGHPGAHVVFSVGEKLPANGALPLSSMPEKYSRTVYFVSPGRVLAQPKRVVAGGDEDDIRASVGDSNPDARKALNHWLSRSARFEPPYVEPYLHGTPRGAALSSKPFPRVRIGERMVEARLCRDVLSPTEFAGVSLVPAYGLVLGDETVERWKSPSSNRPDVMVVNDLSRGVSVFVNANPNGKAAFFKDIDRKKLPDGARESLASRHIRLFIH